MRTQGIYFRRSPAGWRAPSPVCTPPAPAPSWRRARHPATPPPHLSLCPLATSPPSSSTTPPSSTRTDKARFPPPLPPPPPSPRSSLHLPPHLIQPSHPGHPLSSAPPRSLSPLRPRPPPSGQRATLPCSRFPSSQRTVCSTWMCSYPGR